MYKVLIADDDAVDLISMEKLLSSFDVTAVSSLDEILDSIKQKKFHCMVIDCFLGLDDLKEFIHLLNVECPIIAITGLGDERLAVQLLKKGCDDYIAKSNMQEDLLKKVETACEKYSNEQGMRYALHNTVENVSHLCKDIEKRLTKYKLECSEN